MNPSVVSGHRWQWNPPALTMALSLGVSVTEVAANECPAVDGAQSGRRQPLAAGPI